MSRIIFITGAGDGLGRALARQAVARGDIVVGMGRTEATLAETGNGLPDGKYSYQTGDVSDWRQVEQVVSDALARHGRIDTLFANAAVYPRLSLAEHDPADWMKTLAINVGGVMHVCRAVLPAMMAQTSGRILVVGSFADIAPIPDSSAYSASKGALHALVKAINAELAGDFPDILVNEWVPGALNTGMGIPAGLDPELAAGWGLDIAATGAGGPSGSIYVGNQLQVAPVSLKRRIVGKLLGR